MSSEKMNLNWKLYINGLVRIGFQLILVAFKSLTLSAFIRHLLRISLKVEHYNYTVPKDRCDLFMVKILIYILL